MVAVCPQCQMRYEVGDELLQQGSPVMCPSCQVPLQDEASGAVLGAAPSDVAGEEKPTLQTEPSGPAPGWDAGDLLGSDSSPPESAEQAEVPQAQPEAQPEAPASGGSGWNSANWGTVPAWGAGPAQAEAAPAPEVARTGSLKTWQRDDGT